MARNNSRGNTTSAIWKTILREWRTTFAPSLINFSRNVVNVQWRLVCRDSASLIFTLVNDDVLYRNLSDIAHHVPEAGLEEIARDHPQARSRLAGNASGIVAISGSVLHRL